MTKNEGGSSRVFALHGRVRTARGTKGRRRAVSRMLLPLVSVSLAACPEGWLASAVKGSSSCYRIAPKPNGQEACQKECGSLYEGANLVCIRSIEEQLFLAKQFASQPSCCGWEDQSCCWWIGLFQSPTNKGSSVGW